MRSCAVFVSPTGFLPSFLPVLAAAVNPLPGHLAQTLCPRSAACRVPVATPLSPPDCLTVAFSTAFLLPPTEVPVSSVLCLSSVRELPVQVRDLYAQGFVLVAVHPFVHPCGPRHAHIQRQLHRAVLVRETPRYASTHTQTFSGTADAITIKDPLVPVAAVLVTSHSSQTLELLHG